MEGTRWWLKPGCGTEGSPRDQGAMLVAGSQTPHLCQRSPSLLPETFTGEGSAPGPWVNPTEEPVGPPPSQKALQTGGGQCLQGCEAHGGLWGKSIWRRCTTSHKVFQGRMWECARFVMQRLGQGSKAGKGSDQGGLGRNQHDKIDVWVHISPVDANPDQTERNSTCHPCCFMCVQALCMCSHLTTWSAA